MTRPPLPLKWRCTWFQQVRPYIGAQISPDGEVSLRLANFGPDASVTKPWRWATSPPSRSLGTRRADRVASLINVRPQSHSGTYARTYLLVLQGRQVQWHWS